MLVTMPRNVLAEAKTHRVMKRTDGGIEELIYGGVGLNDDEMLSRNSASSRAIPLNKMIEAVVNDPFIPIAWQKDHKGMQGTEYITDPDHIENLKVIHLNGRDMAINTAQEMQLRGVTKQICNRYLEPFMWHTVLVTATEWENFYYLRCPQYQWQGGEVFRSWKDLVKATFDRGANRDVVDGLENMTMLERLQHNKGQAEIHMMALAEAMWDARNESKPKELQPGEWHIPFGSNLDGDKIINALLDVHNWTEEEVTNIMIKIATARAARTSYTIVGSNLISGDGDAVRAELYKGDIALHDRLLASGHMSPFEHCARAMSETESAKWVKGPGKEHGWCHNLRWWKSYRSMIPNENRS